MRFTRRSVGDVIENPREDEFYVLVMRYVPMEIRRRGLKIDEVFDEWDRNLAPSPNLLKWWRETPRTPEHWKEYERRYLEEAFPRLIRSKAEMHKGTAKGKKVVFVCREEAYLGSYWMFLKGNSRRCYD